MLINVSIHNMNCLLSVEIILTPVETLPMILTHSANSVHELIVHCILNFFHSFNL